MSRNLTTTFAIKKIGVLGLLLLAGYGLQAQQFNTDNHWVAPYGVGTLMATAGEEYASLYLVAALIENWEFNAQFVFNYEDPRGNSGAYTATNIYAKHRIWQNESESAGYAFTFGTGLFPGHVEVGEVVNPFQSWWVNGAATFAFNNDKITWDILPGATVNLDNEQSGNTAWGFTYSSRAAFYGVIPKTAIVGEVFGTAGEAKVNPVYRAGLRYESPKWIWALTYSDAFGHGEGAGIELGFMYFTDAIFCNKKCREKAKNNNTQ